MLRRNIPSLMLQVNTALDLGASVVNSRRCWVSPLKNHRGRRTYRSTQPTQLSFMCWMSCEHSELDGAWGLANSACSAVDFIRLPLNKSRNFLSPAWPQDALRQPVLADKKAQHRDWS